MRITTKTTPRFSADPLTVLLNRWEELRDNPLAAYPGEVFQLRAEIVTRTGQAPSALYPRERFSRH